MNKYDLKILHYNGNEIEFGFRNLGGRATGGDKLLQLFYKTWLNTDGGGMLAVMRSNSKDKTRDISMTVSRTVSIIKAMQSGKNIPNDEKLVNATIKILDINNKIPSVNYELEITTVLGSLKVSG